MRDPVI
jgi:hypothetical protein